MEVVYSKSFLNAFERLPFKMQEMVAKKIEIFSEDPSAPSLKTHKLNGTLKNYWAFSVNYSYRVIFIFLENGARLHNVGKHKIYKQL